MPFDRQPVLQGDLLLLRPLQAADFPALYAVAADPLIWEQHPAKNRYQEAVFQQFFQEALESGGALIAIDRADDRIIGSSRFHPNLRDGDLRLRAGGGSRAHRGRYKVGLVLAAFACRWGIYWVNPGGATAPRPPRVPELVCSRS